ncbi:hypothetical protein NX059_008654 [Plenodomus lindquistii]|nr:hypothetical protein NX059_008654 [Plenodomus lindquistii]
MARSLKLFLIRHGETVDNVAQLLAGSRDSELTNHGFQQATRLGLHFKTLGLTFTHLFSSHLQRAVKTAGKIREAQLSATGNGSDTHSVPGVVQLPLLTEQDFGSMEGKKWATPPADASATGKAVADFVAVETKEAMAIRADSFLDEYLIPLLDDSLAPSELVIAIVSHGIFLSTLWKRLLRRFPPQSVILSLDSLASPLPSLEHLGGWSNTGYLELHLVRLSIEANSPPILGSVAEAPLPASGSKNSSPTPKESDDQANNVVEPVQATAERPVEAEPHAEAAMTSSVAQITTSGLIQGWNTYILTINGKDHLKGLKRTGGGVGSSRHDASQKSIDTFFKRRKIE